MDSNTSWIIVQEKNISIIKEIILQHEREVEIKKEYIEVMKSHLANEVSILKSAKSQDNG